MQSNRLISIIIPVYNTCLYLNKCMQSILRQGYRDCEVILVDDGSTDGSAALCDKYAEDNEQVHCVHQCNSGVSSARNAGLSVATGEYIWFCDSDDALMPGALDSIARVILEKSPAMIEFAVEQVDQAGNRLGIIPAPKQCCSPDQGPLQCDDMLFPFAHVVRRDLAEGQLFDTSLALLEDRDFFYRIAWKAAGSTEVIDKPLYSYLITREDSAVNSHNVARCVDATRVHADILENEEKLGHVMPAFRLFAAYSLGVLSQIARFGSRPGDYELVRGRLLEYRRYAPLLGCSLRAKYVLAVYCPAVFNLLSRLTGLAKRRGGPGSGVLVKA